MESRIRRKVYVRFGEGGTPYPQGSTAPTLRDDAHDAAPRGLCAHRLGVYLARRALQLMACPPAPVVPPDAPLDADGWPPEEGPTREMVPPAPEQAGGVGYPVASGIERSPQIGALMGALARAQARMTNPGFDSTNPHYRTRYASLAAVRDAVVPPCNAEHIAVTQLPTIPREGWVGVTTGLWHASGQYLCATFALPVPKGDPQGYGTALTYCRRYGLGAVLCVAGDQDDDAESLRPVTTHGGRAA